MAGLQAIDFKMDATGSDMVGTDRAHGGLLYVLSRHYLTNLLMVEKNIRVIFGLNLDFF